MAIARGQKSPYTTAGAASVAAVFAVNPAAGSSILIFIQKNTATITNVVDNGTTPTTFTLVAGAGTVRGAHVYRADNITLPGAGNYTVTVTLSAAVNCACQAVEYTGLGAAGTAATGSGTSNAPAAGPVSWNAGDLLFGGMSDNSGLNPETITLTTAGMTEQGKNTDGAARVCGSCSDGIMAAGGPGSLTYTLGDAPSWNTVIVPFAPAASGPANVATIDGLAKASAATVDGLALASVGSIDGLA